MASLILLSFLAYGGFRQVNNISAKFAKASEVRRVVTQSEVDHLKWGQKVANTLVDPEGKKLEVQVDGRQCNFGKWYYGEGRKSAEVVAPYLKTPLAAMEDPHLRLHQSAEKINERLVQGDREGAINYYQQTTRPIIQQLGLSFTGLLDDLAKNAVSETKIDQTVGSNCSLVGSLGLLASIALTAVAFFLGRSIVHMIKQSVSRVQEAADQTVSSSEQISSASQTLAEGASEQAAGLEETSSSMEEMASMTRQNADNAPPGQHPDGGNQQGGG